MTKKTILRRVNVRKCGCTYRSENDPIVKRKIEMSGYLVNACPKHARKSNK